MSFRRIAAVTDREAVKKLWPEYRRQGDPLDFEEAVTNINAAIARDDALLTPTEYSKDLDTHCKWCVRNERFLIADPAWVLAVLGHV